MRCADFSTIANDTVDVSLVLGALYSMLKVSFNTVPDSVTKVTLGIAATDTLDSLFTKGSRDTVRLSYDYLAASSSNS